MFTCINFPAQKLFHCLVVPMQAYSAGFLFLLMWIVNYGFCENKNDGQILVAGSGVNLLLITPEKAIKLVGNDFFRHLLQTKS
jgi:hypothetical protein